MRFFIISIYGNCWFILYQEKISSKRKRFCD
ncbi:MAG TPA: cyclic lactone autoinducer peptide [candidate division Zixibacteria bacterium]|nr:cyclic lactone autoinducer peptide [candidate division Zixibacteria bacterium]